jgi:hypothetical protein
MPPARSRRCGGSGFPEDAIARGLESTVWRGRFEILSEKPLIVLDGAHNVAGREARRNVAKLFWPRGLAWGRGEIDGPGPSRFCLRGGQGHHGDGAIASTAGANGFRSCVWPMSGSAEPALLAQFLPGVPCACYDSVAAVWRDLATVHPERLTLITGSLFLVGEMLARGQGNAEEYRLNERLEKWSATR